MYMHGIGTRVECGYMCMYGVERDIVTWVGHVYVCVCARWFIYLGFDSAHVIYLKYPRMRSIERTRLYVLAGYIG